MAPSSPPAKENKNGDNEDLCIVGVCFVLLHAALSSSALGWSRLLCAALRAALLGFGLLLDTLGCSELLRATLGCFGLLWLSCPALNCSGLLWAALGCARQLYAALP